MKKLFLIPFLASTLFLGACDLQIVKNAVTTYQAAASKTVPANDAYALANGYNAVAATATQYLIYCKDNLTTAICSASNRRNVIKYVRVGRQARNQIEAYITTKTSIPKAVYDTLANAINYLNNSPITQAK